MSKKSVVEWMINQLEGYEYNRIKNKNSWADSVKHLEYIKEKAQEMHKEEIVEAYRNGRTDQQSGINKWYNRSSSGYYEITYGGNNE